MTGLDAVEIAVVNGKVLDAPDVETVALAGRIVTVVAEFGIVDRDAAKSAIAGQYSHLVVKEPVIVEGQISRLVPDAGPVTIGNCGAREIEIVDRDITIGDQDTFAIRDQAGRGHFDPTTDAGQGKVFRDMGILVVIGAGINQDGIAALGFLDGSRDRQELLAISYSEYRHQSCFGVVVNATRLTSTFYQVNLELII